MSNSSNSVNKSEKSADASSADQKLDKKDQKAVESASSAEVPDKEKDVIKDIKSGKKRKVNSRTPTPVSVSVAASDISVVVTSVTTTSPTISADIKKSTVVNDISTDKVKKVVYYLTGIDLFSSSR